MNTSKRIGSKKSILFTSLLLCGLFLLLINVQDKDSNHNPSSALEPQIWEVIKRDRQTYTKLVKVDKNGSKQYSITSDMSPLHYLDKAGEWQEYNFHLKKSIKDGYSYELTSSDYQVYFKETLTSFPAVRIERDGRFIDMQPAELQYVNNDGDSQLISKLNTIAKASVVENIITYKNAYGPGIDLMFTVSTSGVKKEVVIQSFDILPLPLIPDSSLEVNIEFSTSSEISVYASETLNDEERQLWKGETIYPKGAIQFKDTNPNSIDRNYDRKIDEDDTIVFESSTAIARDSAEEIAYIDSDTGGLALILQKIDDIKRTSVRTQYNWLKNANYPVYIDPSIGPKNPSSAATLVDGVASFA